MLTKDELRDIDERFWKTIEYERLIFNISKKLEENDRNHAVINNRNSGDSSGT